MTGETDTFARIAGLEPGTPEDLLWRTRPDVVEATQATFDALFEPVEDVGLDRVEREAVALYSATLVRSADVAAFHRARLVQLGSDGEPFVGIGASVEDLELDRRTQAIFRHTELLTQRPDHARDADVTYLLRAGVSPSGIVTLAQLVAFIAFEVRVIAALRAITAGEAR